MGGRRDAAGWCLRWRLWREKRRFRRIIGYEPDLDRPRTYNEKVFARKVRDRDSRFPVILDKVGVREYLCTRLGERRAERLMVPVLHVVERAEDIPFGELPRRCAIKAAHACGWNLFPGTAFVEGLDNEHIRETCRRWLGARYGRRALEWAYSKIPQRILIERLLDDGTHPLPLDFKFYVFHGRAELVNVHFGRYRDYRLSYYDRSFNRLQVVTAHIPPGPDLPPPKNFEAMREIAEELARPFDHMRVDLYNIDGQVRFGEFTPYPVSGKCPFRPESFDRELGAAW